jgi:hypothetical protein
MWKGKEDCDDNVANIIPREGPKGIQSEEGERERRWGKDLKRCHILGITLTFHVSLTLLLWIVVFR